MLLERKKKMLVITNFLFSNDVFKILPSTLSFNPFPKQALVSMCLPFMSFENTVGKGEIARYEQFLLFLECFLSFWRTFHSFHETSNCRLQTLSM